MFDAGCTAVDYAFLRRMTMSARIPNSFELIVRSFLQNAIFAGPFEAKLSRCALCWPVLGPVCIAVACSTMFSINAVVQCLTSLNVQACFPSVGIYNESTLFVLPSSWHMRCSGSASAMPLLKTWHVDIVALVSVQSATHGQPSFDNVCLHRLLLCPAAHWVGMTDVMLAYPAKFRIAANVSAKQRVTPDLILPFCHYYNCFYQCPHHYLVIAW